MKVKIFKIGGNVIDSPEKLDAFLEKFSLCEGPKILVHGGGKIATRLAEKIGLKVTMIDGRRVTDKDMLDIVVMTYAGLINKQIVASLNNKNCNAIGLCGADSKVILSKMRSKVPVDFGFVGDPISVNTKALTALLSAGFVPVIAPITISEEAALLNTNADTVAQTVAVSLGKTEEVELRYEFEKKGVLLDVDDPDSVVKNINPAFFEKLKTEGRISAGMLPKLQNALKAVGEGVKKVYIGETIIEA